MFCSKNAELNYLKVAVLTFRRAMSKLFLQTKFPGNLLVSFET